MLSHQVKCFIHMKHKNFCCLLFLLAIGDNCKFYVDKGKSMYGGNVWYQLPRKPQICNLLSNEKALRGKRWCTLECIQCVQIACTCIFAWPVLPFLLQCYTNSLNASTQSVHRKVIVCCSCHHRNKEQQLRQARIVSLCTSSRST